MNKFFLLGASVLLISPFSCKDISDSSAYPISNQFDVPLTMEEPISVLPYDIAGVETIDIPEKQEHYDIYSLIDTICYVPLETKQESLIGTIDKIVSDASLLFVLDKQNGFVSRFSENGKFLGRVGNKGQERGKYMKVQDMALNTKDKTITLLDPENAKLLIYDYEGRFVKEFPLYYYLSKIEYIGDKMVEHTSMANNSHFLPVDKNQLIISEENQIPVFTGFPYASQLRESFHWSSRKPLNAVAGEVFYHELLSDTIWEVRKDVCRARYHLSYPDRAAQQRKRFINTDAEYSDYLKTEIHFGGDYSFTNTCISFLIGNKQMLTPLFYDRQSKEVLYGNAFSKPRNNLFEAMRCDVFNFSDGDSFIKVIQPFDILRLLKLNKRIVLSRQEQELVNTIKEEDNPILLKVKLKHF